LVVALFTNYRFVSATLYVKRNIGLLFTAGFFFEK
jgi:hypothetical protein